MEECAAATAALQEVVPHMFVRVTKDGEAYFSPREHGRRRGWEQVIDLAMVAAWVVERLRRKDGGLYFCVEGCPGSYDLTVYTEDLAPGEFVERLREAINPASGHAGFSVAMDAQYFRNWSAAEREKEAASGPQ